MRISSSGLTWSSTSGSSAREPRSSNPGTASGATTPTNSYVSPLRADSSDARRRTRLSPAPTSTTRRRIPAARMTSSEADSYAARRRPIVTAETTTDVGMRPEVEKS